MTATGHIPRGLFLALACFLGLGPAASQETMVQRDRLHIVSSGSARAVTESLAQQFGQRYGAPLEPRVEILGSVAALQRFCAGVGASTPDLAISSRRISRSMLDSCRENGVTDVMELELGQGAVVLAVQRGDPLTRLTTRQIYTALAAEQAVDEEFRPNPLRSWGELSPSLPDSPIAAIVPDTASSSRGLFNDYVMEGGCREVKAVRSIFVASYRVSKCTTLRDDSRIRQVASADVPAALLAAPRGTIGVISYAQLLESGGNLVALQLNGVLPTAVSIAAEEYPVTRTIYLYAKRQHARSTGGVGVVRGIREFMLDSVSESAGGPGGLLSEAAGLVPLPPTGRAQQQDIARAMRLIRR